MKTKIKIIEACMIMIMIILLVSEPHGVSAKVIKVVDKSNWEEIKGLVPDPVVEWVKKGDLIMRVGTPNYDPVLCAPSWVQESKTENIGRYELDGENKIVDVRTGKEPLFIKGLPFPKIDLNDPKAAYKIMYSSGYMRGSMGNLRTGNKIRLIGRGGFERYVGMDFFSFCLDGYGPAEKILNPDRIAEMVQVIVTEPYDQAGSAIMNWRYRTKSDVFFGYVPAIRRVRRVSPAERSEGMFGTEITRDDGGYSSYEGAVLDFNGTVLGTGEILGQFLNEDLIRAYQNEAGEWACDSRGQRITQYGYKTPGWKGAPWHLVNTIFVKRPVWIIEGRSKDPYYSFLRSIHYVDRECFLNWWKPNYDRANKYCKMYWPAFGIAQSDDKRHGFTIGVAQAYDERTDHASSMDIADGANIKYWFGAKYDINQFSLSGFIKICK